MFDFFRRKPAPEPAPTLPLAGHPAPEPAGTPTLAEPPPPAPTGTPALAEPPAAGPSWIDRLRSGLGASRGRLAGAVGGVFRRRVLDDEALEELETALLMADVGVPATRRLLDDLGERYRRSGPGADPRELLRDALRDLVATLETDAPVADRHPTVIMLAGVNGAGKTTSIGKLARWLHRENRSVLLAAGDTFRAAAIEQLSVWGQRTGADVVSKGTGADAAGLAFEALEKARATGADVLLIDTAGRLQNKAGLMAELEKIVRVVRKLDPTAPHATLLVLDATTGQNAISQVEGFKNTVPLSGLVMTRLDGTAKGGILAALAQKYALPVHYIGVGEGVDDLQPFNAANFAKALTGAR
ncbi:MAG: signal recognition particle-docking protein FtsY [Casimicrobiaceae bacterium]